ncbi:effector binding domain-containing protein [Paenibacillus caui]|uniref:effector binding domain-containing protein n=1 Tax=Paenibacillus caui TaxID=2873927 RepID=UPI001CAA09BF|nr:effector binding domain-containing protein [Paenibacillus caui]
MDYYTRIQQSIDFIESHLEEELFIADIAAKAHFSPFHFQRLFQAISGSSVQEYIRSRRLAEAARLLESGHGSILDIALSAGYGSQEAFTRAFAGCFGVTPAKFRKQPCAIRMSEPMKFTDYSNYKEDGFHMRKPEIREITPLRVVGRKYRTCLNNELYFAEIPGFYHDFGIRETYMRIPDKAAPDMCYGISCDYEDDGGFSFLVGEEVCAFTDSLDEDLVQFVVPGGKYAVFIADGTAEHVQQVRKYIYGVWLPGSNYERREGPDFEVTDVRNSRYPDEMKMTIYIPIL